MAHKIARLMGMRHILALSDETTGKLVGLFIGDEEVLIDAVEMQEEHVIADLLELSEERTIVN